MSHLWTEDETAAWLKGNERPSKGEAEQHAWDRTLADGLGVPVDQLWSIPPIEDPGCWSCVERLRALRQVKMPNPAYLDAAGVVDELHFDYSHFVGLLGRPGRVTLVSHFIGDKLTARFNAVRNVDVDGHFRRNEHMFVGFKTSGTVPSSVLRVPLYWGTDGNGNVEVNVCNGVARARYRHRRYADNPEVKEVVEFLKRVLIVHLRPGSEAAAQVITAVMEVARSGDLDKLAEQAVYNDACATGWIVSSTAGRVRGVLAKKPRRHR